MNLLSTRRPLGTVVLAAGLAATPFSKIAMDPFDLRITAARVDANNNLVVTVVDPDHSLTGNAYVALAGVPLTTLTATATAGSKSEPSVGTIVATLPAGVARGRYLVSVLWGHDTDVDFSLEVGAIGATGPTGPQGSKGDAGPMGPAGAIGLAGPPGDKGAPGAAGSAGAVGPTGLMGAAGAPGAMGSVGAIGDAGARGAAGPTGIPGDVGATGATGAIGDKGATGAIGLGGAAGPIGAVGATGATGATGPTGATGAIGPPGPQGATGGTGPVGPVGATGPIGPAGPIGATGPAGPTEDLSDLISQFVELSQQFAAAKASIRPRAPINASASVSANIAFVAFDPGADNGAAPTTNYTVTSSPAGLIGSGSASPITVFGLVQGTTYTFTVVATNPAGNSAPSAPTNAVSVAPPPAPPAAPTISSTSGVNGSVVVAFLPPASNGGSPITSYTVTSSPGNFSATGSSSPISVNGLTNGVTYTFTVRATNSVGTGPSSAPSAPTTPKGLPSAPTAVVASASGATGSAASVAFTPPLSNGGSPIIGYVVTTLPSGATTAGATSPIIVNGLTPGSSYRFSVIAVNAVGPGPSSPQSATFIPTGVPSAPTVTGMELNAAGNGFVVSFQPPATNGGSPISSYRLTMGEGQTASAAASPITITGLPIVQGGTYTCTVQAINARGVGLAGPCPTFVVPVTDAPVIFSQFSNLFGRWVDVAAGAFVLDDGSELDILTDLALPKPPVQPIVLQRPPNILWLVQATDASGTVSYVDADNVCVGTPPYESVFCSGSGVGFEPVPGSVFVIGENGLLMDYFTNAVYDALTMQPTNRPFIFAAAAPIFVPQ